MVVLGKLLVCIIWFLSGQIYTNEIVLFLKLTYFASLKSVRYTTTTKDDHKIVYIFWPKEVAS